MESKTKEQVLQIIEEEDIKFIRLQFADFFGVLRNIAVTGSEIERAIEGGSYIDGYHIRGAKEMGLRKIYLKPDIDTFAILPWRPQQGKVGRFLCDLTYEDGRMIKESPRFILQSVLDRAEKAGLSFEVNPECEFFLFDTDEEGNPTNETKERAMYLDMAPLDSGENARRAIIFALEELGFEMESSHHEDAPEQHAVAFKRASGVKMADQILTLRNTVRTIGARNGFHATFMPKPRTDLPGSAMAITLTGTAETVAQMTSATDVYGMSELGKQFLAGVLHHMPGMSVIANPIVNSYKRTGARFCSDKGIFWSQEDYEAPICLVKDGENDTAIRWELPDGATNPYLTIAYLIASGLDGIEKKLLLPEADTRVGSLPKTLKDAVDEFRKDAYLTEVCGEKYAEIYLASKRGEWDSYASEVTDWEIREYLHRI